MGVPEHGFRAAADFNARFFKPLYHSGKELARYTRIHQHTLHSVANTGALDLGVKTYFLSHF